MAHLRAVHWKKFEKFLLEVGCEFVREEGDHRIFWKKGIKRPVILPRYKELPEFIILNNLKILSISRKEFLRIVKQN
ncbi:type II toxin-antitoxin system HicA family toxin [Patescibacteria group bacterium]|nr:type II toxin-antitoxin system HicA family toxin [Patescibacteria group bacterium]